MVEVVCEADGAKLVAARVRLLLLGAAGEKTATRCAVTLFEDAELAASAL